MKTKFLHFLAKFYSFCAIIAFAILSILFIIFQDSLTKVYSYLIAIICATLIMSVISFFFHKVFNE